MVSLWERYRASPLAADSMASVGMNGCGSRPFTKSSPLMTPTQVPVSSAAPTARAGEPWSRQTMAPTTALRDRLEPTDRSIPRVTITTSWPSARTQITADCFRTLPMFSRERKTSERAARTTTSTTRMPAGPIRSAASASASPRLPAGGAGTPPSGAEGSAVPVIETASGP